MDQYSIKKPKILVWDIETSLMEFMGFSPKTKYVQHKLLLRDWHLICAAWKELGKKKVHSVTLLDDPERFKKDIHDDYYVVKKIREALDDVDILIHHNGDQFDLKKMNWRFIYHGLPPLHPILTIDTKKELRKVANPSYAHLDFIVGQFFGDMKDKTDLDLWKECHKGNEKAIRYMDKYCKKDVKLLEDAYVKLKPYMKAHPNLADLHTDNCPRCNSSDTIRHKNRMTASGIQRIQKQCKSCGSYFTLKNGVVGSPNSRI